MSSNYSLPEFPSSGDKDVFYYLYGENPYLIKDTVGRILALYPEVKDDSFGAKIIECSKNSGAQSLYVEIVESSFLSEYRVTTLNNFQRLPLPEKEKLAKMISEGIGKNKVIFASYPPSPKVKLTPAARKAEKFFKELGCAIKCTIEDRFVVKWIIERLSLSGWKIESEAAIFLKNNFSEDFNALVNEIDKLKAYCDSNKSISYNDVKLLCNESVFTQIYAVTDAISRGDAAGAIKAMNIYFMYDEPDLSILFYIRNYFNQLAKIDSCFRECTSISVCSQKLGKHEFVIKKNLEAISAMRPSGLSDAAAILAETDYIFKQGANRKLVFELMMIKLCQLFVKQKR